MKRNRETMLPPAGEESETVKVPSSKPPTFSPYDEHINGHVRHDVVHRCWVGLHNMYWPFSKKEKIEFISQLSNDERQSLAEFLEALFELKIRHIFYGDEMKVHQLLIAINGLISRFQKEEQGISDFLVRLKDEFVELVEHASREEKKNNAI